MPVGAGLAISGAATAYSANRASKSAKDAAGLANAASGPRWTQYGSAMNFDNIHGNMAPGRVVLDPSLRALRERALGRLPGYRSGLIGAGNDLNNGLSQTRAQHQGIYDDLSSNQNPFIQARVNPLMARAAEGRGQISRSMTQRGLGGSSLYSSGMGNYDAQVGREIGDQGAMATAEALNARRASLADMTGIDTQRFNAALSTLQAFQGLDAQEQGVAAQNLAQELSALGLSQAETAGILASAGIQMQAAQIKNETIFRGMDTMGRIAGSYNQSPAPSGNTASPSAYNAFTR